MNPCAYHRSLFRRQPLGRTREERRLAAMQLAAACPFCITPSGWLARRHDEL